MSAENSSDEFRSKQRKLIWAFMVTGVLAIGGTTVAVLGYYQVGQLAVLGAMIGQMSAYFVPGIFAGACLVAAIGLGIKIVHLKYKSTHEMLTNALNDAQRDSRTELVTPEDRTERPSDPEESPIPKDIGTSDDGEYSESDLDPTAPPDQDSDFEDHCEYDTDSGATQYYYDEN